MQQNKNLALKCIMLKNKKVNILVDPGIELGTYPCTVYFYILQTILISKTI